MANRACYDLKKELSSRYFGRQTKCTPYKMLVRPTLTHGSRIYGQIKENGMWRSRYNHDQSRAVEMAGAPF
jgi:hypothetical protein